MTLIQKLKSLATEAIEKLQKEDKDGAVESLKKLADEANTADDTSTTPTPEEVEKMVKDAVVEEVKKYADMYVSADNLKDLQEQLKNFAWTEAVAKITERVEKLEETSNGSQQLDPVNKTSPSVRDE